MREIKFRMWSTLNNSMSPCEDYKIWMTMDIDTKLIKEPRHTADAVDRILDDIFGDAF